MIVYRSGPGRVQTGETQPGVTVEAGHPPPHGARGRWFGGAPLSSGSRFTNRRSPAAHLRHLLHDLVSLLTIGAPRSRRHISRKFPPVFGDRDNRQNSPHKHHGCPHSWFLRIAALDVVPRQYWESDLVLAEQSSVESDQQGAALLLKSEVI